MNSPSQSSSSEPRLLTALPVYNEAAHLASVLDLVAKNADDVLVIDDGSTDETAKRLSERNDIQVVTHKANQGYGAALRTAFCYARSHGYDVLVTIDCDGQHEPHLIRELASHCFDGEGIDIVSGSRYLDADLKQTGQAPVERRRINQQITQELNDLLGLELTDAFCGFKAYRVEALKPLRLTVDGYAMPLELWAQAAHHGLRVREVAVPLIYLDEDRTFGGEIDDAALRISHYREVIAETRSRLEHQTVTPDPDPCAKMMQGSSTSAPNAR